ncbi:23S rRNA (pseudouridine(1915)-N(3))-methyltransferase RlmH [Acidiphilium sp.]|uniref:23S rRNA (pseudouridine(1915)-N(3))-methyltransferase RlmH n=1 Tax=Acidiphilium sp. TaxID=527 RepID=UPI003D0046FB
MRLIAVGRASAGPEQALFLRYAQRTGLELVALADGVGSAVEIKRREAVAILGKIAGSDFVVALDQGGVMPDSVGLARLFEGWRAHGRGLVFVIGGAEGLDGSVLARAGVVVSLGKLTLPHMLARVVLAEQLYRAQSIIAGHPYHRAGRPG